MIATNGVDNFTLRIKAWVKNPESDPELNEWYKSGCPKNFFKFDDSNYTPALNYMHSGAFEKYSAMVNTAMSCEKDKDIETALTIYLDILNKFRPQGTVYYERPCMILERMKLYDQAISICDRAINEITVGWFHASVKTFESVKDRLIKKKQKADTARKD